jgi:hypothetical protein
MTHFFIFGLRGVTLQCTRLLNEININIKKVLFRDVATDLFGRLNGRKRVIAGRQMALLNFFLDRGETDIYDVFRSSGIYKSDIKEPWSAFIRDLQVLNELRSLVVRDNPAKKKSLLVSANLDWPTTITETKFFEESRAMPKAKTLDFLRAYGPHQPAANDKN